MRIALKDLPHPRIAVFDRDREQLGSLFERRYDEQFGNGLILQAFHPERLLGYRPASPSIVFDADLVRRCTEPVRLPNVLGFQSQFLPLVAIWSACLEELSSISRVINDGGRPDQRREATRETITPVVASAPRTEFRRSEAVRSRVEIEGRNQKVSQEKHRAAWASFAGLAKGRMPQSELTNSKTRWSTFPMGCYARMRPHASTRASRWAKPSHRR